MNFTHFISKAILYSKYNDIGHISEILNSFVGQINTLLFVNCKGEERHFQVEFEVVFDILIFLHISYFFRYPRFCIWVQLWQQWCLVLCIHSFYMYTQRKIYKFHPTRSIFTVCRTVLAFKISSVASRNFVPVTIFVLVLVVTYNVVTYFCVQ